MSGETIKTTVLNGKFEFLLKIVVWIVPFIFAAGVWYSSTNSTEASVGQNEKMIVDLSDEIDEHRQLVSHPVTGTKLLVIEQDVQEIKIEQRAMRVEQTKSSINLSAICQATGASCQ